MGGVTANKVLAMRWALALAIASTAIASGWWVCTLDRVKASRASPPVRRVVVLGIDGMDFAMTRSLMRDGKLPHLAALARDGTFQPLATSNPPLSPVAWSNFITGMNPGGHGVYDFLVRDPADAGPRLLPYDAVTRTTNTDGRAWPIPFTGYVWPAQPNTQLRREGRSLWNLLSSYQIPATIYKMPANFPASTGGQGRVLAGMGTPDVEGTYGTFTYLSDRPTDWEKPVSGGRIVPVRLEGGVVRAVRGRDSGAETGAAPIPSLALHGPINPFISDRQPATARRVDVPLEIYVDAENDSAVVVVQGRDVLVSRGEWSPWTDVKFVLLPGMKSVHGWARFYLQEAAPSFRLFISPVNLAAGTEGLADGEFDRELFEALGPYYTKGMAEETKALTQGLFTTDEYLVQSNLVYQEGRDALDVLLSQPRGGLLFFYVSTLDLNCHVLWKYLDPHHPARGEDASPADPRHATSITDLYVRLDALVGDVRSQLRDGDELYVISDHGFGPVYREFNLNAWLAREGYLVSKPGAVVGGPAGPMSFEQADWARTRAYGLGFQSLYVHRAGRETGGVVAPAAYDALVEEIRGKLLALRDDGASRLRVLRGRSVFRAVHRPKEIYSGAAMAAAPDLVLGYDRGYGPSDETVLGTWTDVVLADHVRGFSGHHANDASLVPGVLFSTRRLATTRSATAQSPAAHVARLEDITVTILGEFGVPPHPSMTGTLLLPGSAAPAPATPSVSGGKRKG